MKKIISVLLATLCVACTSVQDSIVTKDSGAASESFSMQYYLVKKKNGELYIHQYDKIFPVEKTIIMDDGVIVTPSGRIYLADGRKFQMREGKKMYLSGSKAGEMEPIATK
jgi:S-adenosylhomocysteine hydrolase